MDALQQPRPRPAKILAFDGDMGSSSRKKAKQPDEPEQKPANAKNVESERKQESPTIRGGLERWSPIALAAVSMLISSVAFLYTVNHDRSQATAASADDHVKNLINEKLEPVIAQLNQVAGQLNQMNWQRNLSELKKGTQATTAKGIIQSDVMADLRANLEQAQKIQQKLPLTEVVQKIQQVPPSAKDYWTTVAAIINYQSYLNQLQGHAPDPGKVAKPCPFATAVPDIRRNVLAGTQHFIDCYVDLDTNENVIEDAVIKDSVVRYHGGKINFRHAVFINCRFIVEIKAPQVPASAQGLLLALLRSDQANFTFSAAG